jgi:hypothetical protein
MLKLVRDLNGPDADITDVALKAADGSTNITDFRETGLLLIDETMCDFFRLAFSDQKRLEDHIHIGEPRVNFDVPSIYVRVPTVQYRSFIGNKMGHNLKKDNALVLTEQYDRDGNVIGRTSNIAQKDAPVQYLGHLAVANATIQCYSDNFDVMRNLGHTVYSLLMHNCEYYLNARSSDYNDTIKENQNPEFGGFYLTGHRENFHDQIAGVKNVYSISFGCVINYIIRVPRYFTYITGIDVTETVETQDGEFIKTIQTTI